VAVADSMPDFVSPGSVASVASARSFEGSFCADAMSLDGDNASLHSEV